MTTSERPNTFDPARFLFRGLHPLVRLGTASDRYAGWIGQIYEPQRYTQPLATRTTKVGADSFRQQVLPIHSVDEFFTHFPVLELDFTFYSPLLTRDGSPTSSWKALSRYRQCLRDGDLLILKAPQLVFARRIRQGSGFIDNAGYLDAEAFVRQFYQPATDLLGTHLCAMVFEQEYHAKRERQPAAEVASDLDQFFARIPSDSRYHVELRTEGYLTPAIFEVYARHGIGQVLSHWTWLPPLSSQYARSGARFLNAGGQCVVRLMTPRGMRYEQAYAKAFPFATLATGMLQPQMLDDTIRMAWEAIRAGVQMNVIINNRAGGNAPLIAQMLSHRLLSPQPGSGESVPGAPFPAKPSVPK